MVCKKAGTILLRPETKQIALVYRKIDNGYSLPKGHLEQGETLEECAIRETEEETLNANHLIMKEPLGVIKYTNIEDGDVETYYYLAVSDGPTKKEIAEADKEIFEWVNFNDVGNKLTYQNLKDFWNEIKIIVKEYLK